VGDDDESVEVDFRHFGAVCRRGRLRANAKFKEDMLASSGFKQVPPTTAAQQASLKSLPPHKLVQTTRKGKVVWAYSDPTICGCLYVGKPGRL